MGRRLKNLRRFFEILTEPDGLKDTIVLAGWICYEILVYLLPVAIVFGVIYSLTTIAQHEDASSQCSSRASSLECGFVGNPDLYGLGIRIGIYLQWLSSFLINVFLPEEQRSSAAANIIFCTALSVALSILTFRRDCTYVVEVIIILLMIFGGFYIAVFPNITKGIDPKLKFHATDVAFASLFIPTILFSCWFWIRLTIGSEYRFTPTPCGTSFFLFTRIGENEGNFFHGTAFMAFLSVWVVTTYMILKRIVVYLKAAGYEKAYWAVLLFNFDGLPIVIGVLLWDYSGKATSAVYNWLGRPPPNWIGEDNLDEAQIKIALNMTCLLAAIFTILAIELNLSWNSITDVYSVDSVGQLIPLAMGTVGLIPVLYKLYKKSFLMINEPQGQDIEAQDPAGDEHQGMSDKNNAISGVSPYLLNMEASTVGSPS